MKLFYCIIKSRDILFLGGAWMKHLKTYHSINHLTDDGQIIIEGPMSSIDLKKYRFHDALSAFRPAQQQFKAILEIANLPEGRMMIARTENTMIGYVTFLYPSPLERWATFEMENLLVLGAIEIAPEYRGAKIASKLLELSMLDNFIEKYIIISTEYYWHWDLRGTGLSIWDYRKVMEKVMASGGLTPSRTDDPEINSHPANCLMVRIGKHVSKKSIEQFDKLRFLDRYYRQLKKEEM